MQQILETKRKNLKDRAGNEEITLFYHKSGCEAEKVAYCHRKKGIYSDKVESVGLA